MPLNQFTQQVNFILSALSGAERIFDMMDEAEEPDEGKVTLCNVIKNADNTITETSDKTGLFAWKLPTGELIELKGDVLSLIHILKEQQHQLQLQRMLQRM